MWETVISPISLALFTSLQCAGTSVDLLRRTPATVDRSPALWAVELIDETLAPCLGQPSQPAIDPYESSRTLTDSAFTKQSTVRLLVLCILYPPLHYPAPFCSLPSHLPPWRSHKAEEGTSRRQSELKLCRLQAWRNRLYTSSQSVTQISMSDFWR
ncbi:hypothetical protein SRHO_G00200740 [Serrasalmus rhombeus]